MHIEEKKTEIRNELLTDRASIYNFDVDYLNERLRETIEQIASLSNMEIKPSKFVGGGIKNARKCAYKYLTNSLLKYQAMLEIVEEDKK